MRSMRRCSGSPPIRKAEGLTRPSDCGGGYQSGAGRTRDASASRFSRADRMGQVASSPLTARLERLCPPSIRRRVSNGYRTFIQGRSDEVVGGLSGAVTATTVFA